MIEYEESEIGLRYLDEQPHNVYRSESLSDFITFQGKKVNEDSIAMIEGQYFYVHSPITKKYWLRQSHSETNWPELSKYINDRNVYMVRRYIYAVVYSKKAITIDNIEANMEQMISYCAKNNLIQIKKLNDKLIYSLEGINPHELAICQLSKSPYTLLAIPKKGDRKIELYISDILIEVSDMINIEPVSKFDIEGIVLKYK